MMKTKADRIYRKWLAACDRIQECRAYGDPVDPELREWRTLWSVAHDMEVGRLLTDADYEDSRVPPHA